MELSFKDVKELIQTPTVYPAELLGQSVIIRTVTHYYTGRVVAESACWINLELAAWIADTGRWSDAVLKGKLNEVEPYPDNDIVRVARGAIVDVAPWNHDLPRTVK